MVKARNKSRGSNDVRVEFAAEEVGIATNDTAQSIVQNLVELTAGAFENQHNNWHKNENGNNSKLRIDQFGSNLVELTAEAFGNKNKNGTKTKMATAQS